MKNLNAVITGIRAKVDGSLGLSVSTPELSNDEKVSVMELQNRNIELLIKPHEEEAEDIVIVDKDLDTKTQSQRIRSILYLIWKNKGQEGDFKDYYYKQTERIIERLKRFIDP